MGREHDETSAKQKQAQSQKLMGQKSSCLAQSVEAQWDQAAELAPSHLPLVAAFSETLAKLG